MYEETGSNICQSFLNIAICEKISYSKGVRKSSHLKKGENMAGKNTDVCLDKNQGERKKYISEVFDIDEQIRKYGNKIMLIAGVGSGKSTWVKEVLSQKGNVLFVTSRRAKVEEDIANSCFSSFRKEFEEKKESLITNAKLSVILQNAHVDESMNVDDFLNCYDYIVVDEIHSMAADSTFARSSFDVFSFVEYAAEKGHNVIVMTGTPEPVQYYFEKNNWHIEDYRKICNYVKPKEIKYIRLENRKKIINQALKSGKKVIYFVNNTVTIINTMEEIARKKPEIINKIATIVSDEKRNDVDKVLIEKFPTYDKSITDKVYKEIVQNQELPEECDILISTSRLKEGIDILNDEVCVICDNHILSNLIQFFGRVRVGNGIVYIIEDAKPHEIKCDPLLYDYAEKEEVIAANNYIEKYIVEKEELFDLIPRFKLINFVKNNPYICYNYIRKKFQVFEVKYLEEKRLLGIRDWQKELKDYCDEYGIKAPIYISRNQIQSITVDGLQRLAGQRKRFYGEDRIKIKNIVKRTLGIQYSQVKRINEELKKRELSFRFYSGKDNTVEHRDESYIEIVSLEEFEKLENRKPKRSLKKRITK